MGDAASTADVPAGVTAADPGAAVHATNVVRSRARLRLLELAGWGAILTAAESTAHVGGIVAGETAYGIALLVLLVAAMAIPDDSERQLAIAFAVLATVRLLSLALPALILPIADWFALVGVPSLLAIALAVRATGRGIAGVGLRRPRARDLVAMAGAGIALGIPGYLILRPAPLITAVGPVVLATTLFSLFAFAAALEELLLRGLVQGAATELFGAGGVAVSTASTALLYAGSGDIRYVVFATLVATLFGLEVRRTGTVAGVVVAHTALLAVQLIVLPAMRA